MTWLVAAAPALPLDEAGKYVAGAYVVFVAVLLIYFGVMASKLRRMERELSELNAALDARARAAEKDAPPRELTGERR
jgi:hypothetical protein